MAQGDHSYVPVELSTQERAPLLQSEFQQPLGPQMAPLAPIGFGQPVAGGFATVASSQPYAPPQQWAQQAAPQAYNPQPWTGHGSYSGAPGGMPVPAQGFTTVPISQPYAPPQQWTQPAPSAPVVTSDSLQPPMYADPASGGRLSTAKIVQRSSGVESDDPLLNNKEEALLFLTNYNTRPGVKFEVRGSHTEEEIRHHCDANGQHRDERIVHTIQDFSYSFDITNHILDGGVFDGRAAVDKYAASTNTLKRCVMQKVVNADFEAVRQAIVAAIRCLGYNGMVSVQVKTINDKVVINNSDDCSKFLRDDCTKVLCFLSCACLVWYPIKWAMEGSADGDQLVQSVFQLDCTVDELIGKIAPLCGAYGTTFDMAI